MTAFHFRGFVAALLILAHAATAAVAAPDPASDGKTAADLRQRADKGDAGAALQLGNLLNRNQGLTATFGHAADWYRKGCALNSLSACHNAGVAYEQGRYGVQRNPAEAANFYLQAAERAFLPSQFNLAALYANAQVTSMDNREGLKWLLVAQKGAAQCADRSVCKFILEDRRGHRARLEAMLSAAERREALQLAEAWRPLP